MRLLYFCFLWIFSSFLLLSAKDYTFSQDSYSVHLSNDTLTIENDVIRRTWLWNGGNLITTGFDDKENNVCWKVSNRHPDLSLPGEAARGTDGEITASLVPGSLQYVAHVRVTIQYKLGELEIRKILKIYEQTPAIATEIYMRGKAAQTWVTPLANAADLQNIEMLTASTQNGKVPVMDQLVLAGKHWKLEAVEFYDITDRFNTLVHKTNALLYRNALYRGNLLFAENTEKGSGFFMLKEAPTSNIQLRYPNGDFMTGDNTFQIIGLGIDSVDLKSSEWTRAYGYTTGLFQSGEFNKLQALKKYQKQIRPFLADRDEMIMLNTWGDRGQDTRVNEAFCLNELELASKLGITHFQIDDGWQAGRSANSAYGGTFRNIWDNPDYWTPDPQRFPNGLDPIVKRGKELGIEVCLWFNPSIQHNYEDWEKDARALISLYKKYGIRTFKIDGTAIPNKLSEERLRNLYERVMEATGWEAVLNLDATAGRRGGYFFFNEYGNIFLENRYTDWQNYYPYWTLRNLWMLSAYVPPQTLQIEFLNKWRNREKYGDDRFAPDRYSFDYLFAITMAAQPLAWLEAANLPEEAFQTSEVIQKYKSIQHDFHTGDIFPIGEEPSGKSWCGFQSVKGNEGYILVFREDNKWDRQDIICIFDAGETIQFTPILGNGKEFNAVVTTGKKIGFTLPSPNSYALYHYTKQTK